MRSNFLAAMAMACALVSVSSAAAPTAEAAAGPPSVTLSIDRIDRDVVGEKTPGMAGVKYGAEGGEIVRDDQGTYHWFTSEQFGDPYWVANRIAHWTSPDGLKWQRDSHWIKEGNHDESGVREKSNYFDPTVVYDEKAGYWYMFYVAYRYSKEKTWYVAKIYRAKAVRPGRGGVGGPYHDNDADDVIVLGPVDKPGPYEAKWVGDTKGGYGAASVTIYRAGDRWYMLWAENMLATAASPSGVFTRMPEGPLNPVTFGRKPMDWVTDYIFTPIQKYFYYENPAVIRIPEGRAGSGAYLMFTGAFTDSSVGATHVSCAYATSEDGLHWSEMRPLYTGGPGDCATAVAILPDADGSYTAFITSKGKGEDSPGEAQSSGAAPAGAVPGFETLTRLKLTVSRR